ncbi:MAG: type I pullulanase [Spirochaetales bacterium]|nr:type I pullulanase [Spirochaetales bacterium]
MGPVTSEANSYIHTTSPAPDCRQLILRVKGNVDVRTSDIWVWWAGQDGRGYLFGQSPGGPECRISVPRDIGEVGFMLRTNCSSPGQTWWGDATKDQPDRFARLEGETTIIYLIPGDPGQYVSEDGGRTLRQIRHFDLAALTGERAIEIHLSPGSPVSPQSVRLSAGGRQIPVAAVCQDPGNLSGAVIKPDQDLGVDEIYEVEIEGYGSKTVVPTGIFDTDCFKDRFLYKGSDLGAVVSEGMTRFRLWAPTASQVTLNLYSAGCDPEDGRSSLIRRIPMERSEKGTWIATSSYGHGTYYTYTVTTASGENEAVDPYARALGVNGNRGMVVDLRRTDPEGFGEDSFVHCTSYSEAVVWEVHVRDFSSSLDGPYRGKFLAFCGDGYGLAHLSRLGVTHVHLQPVADFATVDERNPEGQYNWGYDPKNYNAPEGSYSSDPYDGAKRIREFKQLVQSLHSRGIGVVMDVVYNHTYERDSCLNRTVPYYYYRYDSAGKPSNGSGCGNETASERYMMRKFIIDSLLFWMKEYHVDGFRFDLMALHDVRTIQEAENKIHSLNPSALIYGEGWTGGTSALEGGRQASLANIGRITASNGAAGSVAVFNDVIRDALKGSVFSPVTRGYINGAADAANAAGVCFGLSGGRPGYGTSWSVPSAMVVNYMSAHDNFTLWDKLRASNPGAGIDVLMAQNRLGAAIIMLSRGLCFMLAGEEMLRTKNGDGNSYNSPDAVNRIDWDAMKPGSPQERMTEFYSKLIALRRRCRFITASDVRCRVLGGFAVEASYIYEGQLRALALFNPSLDSRKDFRLHGGNWKVLMDGEYFADGAGEKRTACGTYSVAPMSAVLLEKQD